MNWLLTWTLLVNIAIITLFPWQDAIWWIWILLGLFTLCFYKKIFQSVTVLKGVFVFTISGLILGHFFIFYQPPTLLQKTKPQKIIATITHKFTNFYLAKNQFGKKIYINKFYYEQYRSQKLSLDVYDQLEFCGKTKTIDNPQLQKWLWKTEQIIQQTQIITKQCSIKITYGTQLFNKIKNYLKNLYQSKEWSWIQFLLFQQTTTDFIPIKQQITRLGILHLFVISGFHLLIWTKFWFWWAQKSKKNYLKNLLQIIGLGSCFFLVYLTNWKISALKSLFLLVLFWINSKLKQPSRNPKEQIAFIALLFMVWNPLMFWKTSFQLSFCASWFLFDKNETAKSSWKKRFREILFKNLLITIVILPIIVQFNYHIPIFSPLYNLGFTFLIGFLYPVFFLTVWIPYLVVGWKWIFHILLIVIKWSEKSNLILPFSMTDPLFLMIYYGMFICMYGLYLRFGRGKEIFLLSTWALSLIFIVILKPRDKNYHLHMINVGHGLAMLLHNPNKTTTILFDAGWGRQKINWGNKITKHLQKHNIHHLDAIFLSHKDVDHHNNMSKILNTFPITKIYTNQIQKPKYRVKEIFINNLAYPYYQQMSKENNRSLVLQTTINGYHFLFPFDLEKKGEKILLQNHKIPKINILQIAHHGSTTSSHEMFLKTTKPQHCLVSGRKMSSKTWQKLTRHKCQIWTTWLNGDIILHLQKKILIKTNKK